MIITRLIQRYEGYTAQGSYYHTDRAFCQQSGSRIVRTNVVHLILPWVLSKSHKLIKIESWLPLH